jgi:hypothetical protein
MQEASSKPAGILLRRALRVLAWVLLAPWLAWCAGALWFGPWPWPVRLAVALAVAAVLVWAVRRRRLLPMAASVAGLLTCAWCALVHPRGDRPDWSPDQARMPEVVVDGSQVTVRQVRDCRYRTVDDYDARWEERRYDLDRIASVWFVVEPFSSGSPAAHTFLSFGFDGGDYIAVSVEIRKRIGEHFSPVAALFRRYELMYVIADERDAIAVRLLHRHHAVYLYPLRATRPQARQLFADMLARADALRTRPEFYDTLTNTCTTNIVAHVNAIWPGTVPLRREILLPGNADRLAYELGMIACDEPFPACRERCRIDAQGAGDERDPGFSRRIRTPVAGPQP